jgi:hypothetical protein
MDLKEIQTIMHQLKETKGRQIIEEEYQKKINELENKIFTKFSCNYTKREYCKLDLDRILLILLRSVVFQPDQVVDRYDVLIDDLEQEYLKSTDKDYRSYTGKEE